MVKRLKKIRPLVVGVGVAGQRHLDAQLNLGIKTGVYTTNPKISELLKQNPNVIIFNSLEDGIKWSNLVHICTPDDKHTEYVALALKKGKAVLCEKSFTTKLKDALYLQRIAHKYNSLLIVGQNYRLTPTFAEIRKRILAGELGTLNKIQTTYLHDTTQYQQRTALRKNKDFLYIGGSHAVDLACWVANEQVLSVQAVVSNRKISADDYPKSYQIVLTFASGLLGYIKLDASHPRSINGTDLIVSGEKGKLVSHNKIDQLLIYKRSLRAYALKKGVTKAQSIQLPNNQTFTTALEVKIIDDYLLNEVASCLPLPAVDEAVNTIRVLDTIHKAVISGKKEPVDYSKPNLSIF